MFASVELELYANSGTDQSTASGELHGYVHYLRFTPTLIV